MKTKLKTSELYLHICIPDGMFCGIQSLFGVLWLVPAEPVRCTFVCMYAARVGLRGMSDPHSNWSDTGAGVGTGPMVSDGLAGGGSSTPVVPPPVGGAFPYNDTVGNSQPRKIAR